MVLTWFRRALTQLLVSLSYACAPPAAAPDRARGEEATLVDARGGRIALGELASQAALTVLVFHGEDCHCERIHERRLAALASALRPLGVRFYWVDSEEGASLRGPRAEGPRAEGPRADAPRMAFPFLIDSAGRAARALGARYATYSVVLDSHGAVRYRGAVDSDRVHLTEAAVPYLANALNDCLSGREPDAPITEALGCALRLP